MPLPTLPPDVKHALLAAGYKLDDEFSESLGLIALDAAVTVARAAGNMGGGGGRAADKVGRNDPCPCGSGKKYKRCCLDKAPAADAPAETPGPTPLETPELIPCLDGPDGWVEGVEQLEKLLLADPELRGVRFDELAVLEYLQEHAAEIEAAHDTEKPEAVQDVMEGLATRYARTVDRMATVKRLARVLKEVAPAYRTDAAALRGLATGLAFAALPSDDEDLPLATTLFRFASFQPAHDAELVQQVVAPDNEDVADLLGNAGSQLLAQSREAVAPNAEAAAALERLIARAEGFEGALEALIAEGRFPVAVPFCVWAVMHRQALKKAAAEAGGEPGAAAATPDGATTAGSPEQPEEGDWLRTAAATYGDILGEWLERNAHAPRSLRGLVRWLASQLVDHGFTRVSLALMARALDHAWTSFLPGEAELLAAHGGPALVREPAGEGLAAYAAFLSDAGYAELAALIQPLETAPSPS